MKEHQRTDRLTLITILLVLLVAIVLIAFRTPSMKFKLSPEETLTLVQGTEHIVTTSDAKQMLSKEDLVFIDIRKKGEYVIKHLNSAINIPLPQLLNKESLDLFNDKSKTYVLYSEDHNEANGAWILLRQLGIENVRVLLGGFNNYLTESIDFPHKYNDFPSLIKGKYDIREQLEKRAKLIGEEDAAKALRTKEAPTVRKPISKPKSKAKVLPPPVEEEEEDEGC